MNVETSMQMSPTDYTDRHNQVASIIHWNICRHFQITGKTVYAIGRPICERIAGVPTIAPWGTSCKTSYNRTRPIVESIARALQSYPSNCKASTIAPVRL